MSQSREITITLGDGFLHIEPVIPEILFKRLKYWRRQLEWDAKQKKRIATGRYEELYSINSYIDQNTNEYVQQMTTLPGFAYKVRQLIKELGYQYKFVDVRTPMPKPDYMKAMEGLREYQMPCVYTALASGGGIVSAYTGYGKCLAPDTKILFYDGTIKPIAEVRVGDQLMGDDATPRTVLGRVDGFGPMCRIEPKVGNSFECSKQHILSLAKSGTYARDDNKGDGHIEDITVEDYVKQNNEYRRQYKLYHASIEFKHKKVAIDPYFINNPLRTSFKVTHVQDGPYVGVKLDGNMRHLLADCTVVHNTHVVKGLVSAYSKEELLVRNTPLTIIAAPDKDITAKNYRDLKELLPDRDVGLVMSGFSKFSDDVQVITLDSLHKLNPNDIGVAIVDEVHTAGSDKRTELLLSMHKAAKWGVSATPTGRFDGRDLVLEGIFGPVVFTSTFQDGVKTGAVVPIEVFWITAPEPTVGLPQYLKYKTRVGKYRQAVWKNDGLNKIIADILRQMKPDNQVLTIMQYLDHMNSIARFCDSDVLQVHAETSADKIAENGFDFIKAISQADRRDIYKKMESAEIRKILSTYVYKQGVNFPLLNVVIQAGGGGSDIVSKQIPGRESRKAGEKEVSYLVDFWHPWDTTTNKKGTVIPGPVYADDRSREKAYSELGFRQTWITDISKLPFIVQKDEHGTSNS